MGTGFTWPDWGQVVKQKHHSLKIDDAQADGLSNLCDISTAIQDRKITLGEP